MMTFVRALISFKTIHLVITMSQLNLVHSRNNLVCQSNCMYGNESLYTY